MPNKKETTNPKPLQLLRSSIAQDLLNIFNKKPTKFFNPKQLAAQLGMQDAETRKLVEACLEVLVADKKIEKTEHSKYRLAPSRNHAEGKIQITAGGDGYITPENSSVEVYIQPKNTHQALNGDFVKINLFHPTRGKRQEGEVLEIVKRAKTEFSGVLQMHGSYGFVVPDSRNMGVDIFIPQSKLSDAKEGQKVIASMEKWLPGAKNPEGSIIKVLGWPGENDAEIHAILNDYGLPYEFPEEVIAESEKIKEQIPTEEIKKRRDMRGSTTFTIDPVDAKDFDDALSIEKLENGHWEIGVHIADVSYYVKPGSALDKEASERATSVYLVDRVVPMLPEKLSNVLCSLRPHEDKLCFSAVFEMDDDGKVYTEWFGRTVIHSDHRFSYEEAQLVIETESGPFASEIVTLQNIAVKLRAQRFKAGAIAFEKKEIKFKLDDKGKPVSVYVKEAKESNKLIEEFMLLANRSVAAFCGKPKGGEKKGKTFVYRIHDQPSADKLSDFANFAKQFGYQLKLGDEKQIASSLNNLMKDVHGKKEQNVLETLAIRTMAKAAYSTENIGHYGLAFPFYSHFTSPIRRYPDVLAHRLLQHYLDGGKSVDAAPLEEECKHSTAQEIKAAQAERDSIKYKQVEYLKDRIGESFEGFISGLTDWGMYVEFENGSCEGMIRLKDIHTDFYEFQEDKYQIKGRKTGKIYKLGDAVTVILKRADLVKKQIDLAMTGGEKTSRRFEDEWDLPVAKPKRSGGPAKGRKR